MSTTPVETPDVKVPATPVGSRFFKAVRRNGTDFHSGTVRWLPADGAPIPEGGWIVEHPHPGQVGSWDAIGYLSGATVETDCAGFQWPARLLLVEPIGDVWTPNHDKFPHKMAAHAWRVVGELPAWQLFGPQGRQVAALIEQTAHLTSTQIDGLSDAWEAALVAAQRAALVAARGAVHSGARGAAHSGAYGGVLEAVLDAALVAARGTAWGAALNAAWDAALGWLVKDLISVEDSRTLTDPWEQVVGRVIA